ncbi:MAG TPA: S8 family peptidase [Terriglobales bacterium]|nr:S8 family peptidase [Terriglobales bacterium]
MQEQPSALQRTITRSATWGGAATGGKQGGKRQRLVAFAIAACMALALAVPAAAKDNHSPKLSPDLRAMLSTSDPSTLVDVIVQYKVKPQAKNIGKALAQGGRNKAHFNIIQAESYTLPLSELGDLANDSDVKYVSLDHKVKMTGAPDFTLVTVNADIAQAAGYDGSGVGIAVVDSGIYAHDDLNAFGTNNQRVVYSESFVPGDPGTSDAYGHGTHVAGIAAGNGTDSMSGYRFQYTGVAPNANIINLRVLDATGSGSDSSVIAALQRAIDLKTQYNIRVINLSVGRGIWESYQLDPLDQAVEQAWKAGIVVVVAAGNAGRDNSMHTHGYATITAPGNDPFAITVGAMSAPDGIRSNDVIASYSSKGPTLIDHIVKPDIVAPGNQITSLRAPNSTLVSDNTRYNVYPCDVDLTNKCGAYYGPPQYFKLSGTSMASPVVAGAAALMIQKDPSLTPDLVKARLMKTAFKGFRAYGASADATGNVYNNQADVFTYGAGYLDVNAALGNSDTGAGFALSPTAVYNSLTHTVTITNTTLSSNSVVWGSSVLWGNSVLWGSSVLWGNSVIWGANAFVSGSSVLWGNSVIWGANIDTGFSVIWGNSVIWGASTSQAMDDGDSGDCTVDDTGAVVCPVDPSTTTSN